MLKKTILEQLQKQHLTPEGAKALLACQVNGATSGDVAIIGLSCQFPGADNADTFWQNLAEGKSFLGPLPASRLSADFTDNPYGGFLDEDIHAFDARFFDIPDEEARQMDPQQKYFLKHAWAAIENAGYVPSSLENKQCGVYAAIGGGDYFLTQKTITPYTAAGFLNAFLVSRLSYFLNLTGPCLVIDSACTSALSALHLARQSLMAKETDIMLVGSFNILSSSHIHTLCRQSGLISPSGRCQPFSSHADGWLPGEGGAVVVLRRLADALEDGNEIYGVIKGSGINHNGRSNGMQAPRASRQLALQQQVCEDAGIAPASIDYLEAQGVCSPMGDSIEFHAMRQGLARPQGSRCRVSTTKPNIGHLLAASGMASVINVLMSIKYQAIAPVALLRDINPALEAEKGALVLNQALTDWRPSRSPRRAAINGCGLTGVNVHLIIEEPPVNKAVATPALPDSTLALHQRCKKYMAEIIQQQTGHHIEEGEYHKNFINLGINSVNLLPLSGLLEKQTGIHLNPMIYFEHPNINTLTDYLIEKHSVALTAFFTFYQSQNISSPQNKLSQEELRYLSVCEERVTIASNRIITMSDILLLENTPENRARWPLEKELFNIADDFYQRFNTFAENNLQGKALSRAFIHQLHQKVTLPFLTHSQILKRFFEKPRGYAGDFETIEKMYHARPEGKTLLDFWFDKWAYQLDSMLSVQNRRTFIRQQIRRLANAHADGELKIMSIACGPASEIFESLIQDKISLSAVCVDLDADALNFVSKKAREQEAEAHITCQRENAFQLSETFITQYAASQHLISSIGLIDYFADEVVITLLNQLYQLLQPGGQIILGNICDTCPERHISNYLLDWLIIYRSPEQMYHLFERSLFNQSDIEVTIFNDETCAIQLYALGKK